MTNNEAIRVLGLIKKHPSMQVYLPDEYEALDLAIKALDLITRLDGFKYVTTDVLLKENETAHFDVYKQGWNDAIQAVINASDRPLSEIVEAIKEAEVKEGGRKWQ